MRLHAFTALSVGPQLSSYTIPILDADGTGCAFLNVDSVDLSDAADNLADGDTVQYAIDYIDGKASDTYDSSAALVADILGGAFDNQAAGVVLTRDDNHYLLTVYYCAL